MTTEAGVQVFIGPANQLELGDVVTGPPGATLTTLSETRQRLDLSIPSPTQELVDAADGAVIAAEAAALDAEQAQAAAEAAVLAAVAAAKAPTEAQVQTAVDAAVPPAVTAAVAADETVIGAAAAAVTAELAVRDLLVALNITVDEVIFGITDKDDRRTWLEINTAGGPTIYASGLIAAAVTPTVAASVGVEDQDAAISGLAFAVVDANGLRTELEVGLDGKLSQRVIDSIASRLVLPDQEVVNREPEPAYSTKVKAWDATAATYNLHPGNLRNYTAKLAKARAGVGTCHVMCGPGDSRTYGAHATGASNPKWSNSWPGRIRRNLDRHTQKTSGTGIVPFWDAVFGNPAHDPRYTWGSGVTSRTTYGVSSSGYGPQGLACAILDNSAGNGWISFAPTQAVNMFTVWLVSTDTSAGLATIKVDGASRRHCLAGEGRQRRHDRPEKPVTPRIRSS